MSAWEEEIERSWAYQEMFTLSEEKQRKSILYDITYMWNLSKNDTNEFIYKIKQTHRLRGKIGEG